MVEINKKKSRKGDDKCIMSAEKHYTIIKVTVARQSNNFGSVIFH